jgi:methionyl-tRNA synthetase
MRVLIAVAWPYASGPRHLGHVAGAYLPADIVARYHRLAGDDVLMVSGSDQHGTPITIAAEKAGVPVPRFADEQHEAIARSFERLGISFDIYTKTTTGEHRTTVQGLFSSLHRGGHISEGEQRSAWCPAEGRSLPDRYVEGTCPHCGNHDARGDQCDACGQTLDPEDLVAPRCRRCGSSAEFRPLRQLFLRLDLLQPAVERYLRERGPRWRPFVWREAEGWVRGGLHPRAITRDLEWGVPVPLPGWEDRRLYVWFDAVIGYLSASIEWGDRAGDPEAWRRWWEDEDADHRYFIGKDNVPFHAVWWPAVLLGPGGLHPPDDIVANHYLTLAGAQMSASRGHGFTIDEAIDRVGIDPLRHALCAMNPETADTEFTWERADDEIRTGLLGSIANPVHRVTTLLWTRFGGRVDPEAWRSEASADVAAAGRAVQDIGARFREARLRDALEGIHELGRIVNRRLAETEPWHLPDRQAHRELTILAPYLDAIGLAAYPVVPETAGRIRQALGRPREPRSWTLDPAVPPIAGHPEPVLRTR